MRQVGSTPSVALTIGRGQSKVVKLGSGKVTSTWRSQPVAAGSEVSGKVQMDKDSFYSFSVPKGVSYIHIHLAFGQKYADWHTPVCIILPGLGWTHALRNRHSLQD